MPVLLHLEALEVLDGRGRPTVRASCVIDGGTRGTAAVSAGGSAGRAEAVELRDGDPTRYDGQGCRKAVAHIEGELRGALVGKRFADQGVLDRALVALDGTPDKSRLGANALLAVSLAFARAHAMGRAVPLYRQLAEVGTQTPERLPRPMFHLFSGGRHAGGQIAVQDLLVVPTAARLDDVLAAAHAVHRCAAELVARKYGLRPLTTDEGAFAPPFSSTDALFDDALGVLRAAGLSVGQDVWLGIDLAASHIVVDERYLVDGVPLAAAGLIERLTAWCESHPIAVVEDGLAEEDWGHWPALVERIGRRAAVVGDDLLCSHPERLRRAIKVRAANGVALKVGQVGTLSEAAETLRLARQHGWSVTVAARRGETEDDWLTDLAVGWGADLLKAGALTRSDRVAKYNRLLAIERETRWPLAPMPRPPA